MGIVYHGSKEHGIKRLEPRKSTHGVYVYATPEKVLALNFSGRCGDDLTYDIGKFVYSLDRDIVVMVKIYNDNINVYPNDTIKAMEENLLENIKANFKHIMVEQETIDIENE